MKETAKTINEFLVEVFHEVLKSEEQALSSFVYQNLSLREMHVIETVVQAKERLTDNCASAIAAALRITAGSLSTAINTLERKGYLVRQRDERDRRIVHILPTPLGEEANAHHQRYHQALVEHVLQVLNEEEAHVFVKGLSHLSDFFTENQPDPGTL